MYLCRELTGNSLADIGSKLGNRHHSTILHSIELIEKKLKNSQDNEELKKTLDVLNKKIHNNVDLEFTNKHFLRKQEFPAFLENIYNVYKYWLFNSYQKVTKTVIQSGFLSVF